MGPAERWFHKSLSQLFYYHVRATGRYAPNFRRITAFALRAHPLVGDKFSSVKDRLPNKLESV